MLYLIYRLTTGGARGLIDAAPDLLDETIDYQLATCDQYEQGEPVEVRLHPAIEYSLGITRNPPDEPETDRDQITEDP